ncbi:beta-lactamase/transpeptidase-like protein [Mycena polygramma]|nr:beta-lactamase/transpeptidase-like protein [Mycena polygramma]
MAISTARTEAIDRILSNAMASKSTLALFFGATTANGPIYIGTAGTKSMDDPTSGAVDEDTIFWLCSEMKLITSIAALQLIEHGKIGLDTAVETVLPELANPVVVTAYDEAGKDGEDVSTFFKIIKGSLPGIPLKCEPGTDFTYGFSTDCQEHIFAPLGITFASFYLTPALKNRLLPLSYRTKSGQLERWNGPPEVEQDPAHAGSVKNPILSRTSVDSIFNQTLPPAAATTISGFVGVFHPRLSLPPDAGQFGHGLFVTTADVPGKRKSGSGSWDG